MISTVSSILAIMFALFTFSFAQIGPQRIPEGIMYKRQAAGTGASTQTTTQQTTTQQTTTQQTTDTPTTTIQTTSTNSPSQQTTTTPTTSNQGGQTTQQTTPSQSQSPSQAPTSTEVPTTVLVTTTNADGSTVTSSIATSKLAPASSASSTGIASTLTGSSSNLVVVGSSTINRSTLSSATVITSALVAEETAQSTYTTYWTSNGHVYSSVVTTGRVFSSTTGFATATISPELANGGGNSGSNLSPQNKAIIGGVVGGVGGAILIGGLAVVAWRLWGKKRRQSAHDDFLDSQDDNVRREKRSSAQPLYHNPGGPVTASSNF